MIGLFDMITYRSPSKKNFIFSNVSIDVQVCSVYVVIAIVKVLEEIKVIIISYLCARYALEKNSKYEYHLFVITGFLGAEIQLKQQ